MAKHSEKTSPKFFLYILIIILLCVIAFVTIKFVIPKFTNLNNKNHTEASNIKTNNTETENLEISIENISSKHAFQNLSHLSCENFSLTVENDITTINGTILNDSDDIINELVCSFELKDKNNATIYEFDITISEINSHSSSSFAYMALLDLSNVNNYLVKTIN